MEFNNMYAVLPTLTKDQFKRRVLIEIGTNATTPAECVNAVFGEIKEEKVQIAIGKCHVETDCTCTIGYDRVEEYWTKEKKTEYINGQSYERMVDVKKTRIVTDWQPFSTHQSGEYVRRALNGKYDDKVIKLRDKVFTKDIDKVTETSGFYFSDNAASEIKRSAEFANECSINLPGDHQKDIRKHSTSSIIDSTLYEVVFYRVSYEFDGETYEAVGCTNGDFDLVADFPPSNIDIVSQSYSETVKDKKLMIASWILTGVFAALSIGLLFLNFYFAWIATTVFLIISIVLTFIRQSKFNSKLTILTDDNMRLKLDELNRVLLSLNYESYSKTKDDDETNYVDDDDDDFDPVEENENEDDEFDEDEYDEEIDIEVRAEMEKEEFISKNKKTNATIHTIWTSICVIALIIVSFVLKSKYDDERIHDVNNFNVDVVNIRATSNEGYYSTTYRVYVKYKVKSSLIGASSVSLKTVVYSQSGSTLGTMTSSINNLNLGTYSLSYQEVYFEKYNFSDSLFNSLYHGEVGDFKFVTTITSITYSDGTADYVY